MWLLAFISWVVFVMLVVAFFVLSGIDDKKIRTNADRLRNMTDIELFHWLEVYGSWPFDEAGTGWKEWLAAKAEV